MNRSLRSRSRSSEIQEEKDDPRSGELLNFLKITAQSLISENILITEKSFKESTTLEVANVSNQ